MSFMFYFIFVKTTKNFQKLEVKTSIFDYLKVICLWRVYFHNRYLKLKTRKNVTFLGFYIAGKKIAIFDICGPFLGYFWKQTYFLRFVFIFKSVVHLSGDKSGNITPSQPLIDDRRGLMAANKQIIESVTLSPANNGQLSRLPESCGRLLVSKILTQYSK